GLFWFDFSKAESFQLIESYSIIKELGVSLRLGVDGFSYLMLILTVLTSTASILWSLGDYQVSKRQREYYFWLLMTELGLIGVFSSLDLIVFYVFYELTLVPMFFVIGIWGYSNKVYSATKFFIYIFVSSLFLLLGISALAISHLSQKGYYSFSYQELMSLRLEPGFELFVFLLFLIAFAVKTPLVPFHTWLPDAHGDAPTAGSVLLAAVLLKMGTYALLRFNVVLFPQITTAFVPIMVLWGILSITLSAWFTISQTNIKRFVAYSSISHMGFVVSAMFMLNSVGIKASITEMFAHGLTSAGFFMMAGFIYSRLSTFDLSMSKGSAIKMPVFAILVGMIAFSSMGLPGGSSFWGKFLTILSASQYTTNLAILVLIASFFSAVYVLYLVKNLYLDSKKEADLKDITGPLLYGMALMSIPTILVGLLPSLFFVFYDSYSKYVISYLFKLAGGG
ncbi:MAG: NADH-quinone oxidoreductase subunit M, partial [Aquificaceae bacterium]|nr:NADH-quinone oxidoreductase subunit M [Aquificaceae bacterium]